jgi:tetratricopeptide (TPR) repeat protein
MKVKLLPSVLIFLFFLFIFPFHAFGESALLFEGIEKYNQENYEEAVEALIKARMEDPKSSRAAFFLGLAYKQVMDYQKAAKNFRDAVTLTPRIKEALVELVEVLYRLPEKENLEEAKKWIEVGEKEDILPAKIAFLKGMVLQREDKNLEAVKSFEKAESLDPSYTQSAEFQIAQCYVKERDLNKAKKRFAAAVRYDPRTDLADFARRYEDLVAERMFLERPLRFTLGAFGQYDDNMVLMPSNSTLAAPGTNEQSAVLNTSLRADYVPMLKGPWLFNAQYAIQSSLHQKNVHTHDSLGNNISIYPGYDFGNFALNLAASYSYIWVRNPSYKKYANNLNIGPLFRTIIHKEHMLDIFAGWDWNGYLPPTLDRDDDRDSSGLDAYISWIWLFKKDALFNLRYEYRNVDTDGKWWDYDGHAFSANLTIPIPLIEKLKLQLSGEILLHNYKNDRPDLLSSGRVVFKKRDDNIYMGSIGITWEFFRNTTLIAQYSRTDADSNIGIYDYDRNLYTAGIEYRF